MAEAKSTMTDRLFVRRVLIVLGLAAVFFLLWQLRMLLLMLFGAIVVATIFRCRRKATSSQSRRGCLRPAC